MKKPAPFAPPRSYDRTKFNKDKETIELKGLTGTVAVMAKY